MEAGAGGGGGEHEDGSGGFSAGGANRYGGVNGLVAPDSKIGGFNNTSDNTNQGFGGSYYEYGGGHCFDEYGIGQVGGQGACWGANSSGEKWELCTKEILNGKGIYTNPGAQYCGVKSGDGGAAGKGGEIHYKDINNIFAFNGDRVTDGNYENVYEFICVKQTNTTSKTIKTDNVLSVQKKINNENFIPTFIFAQNGQFRETYTTNFWQYEIDKIQTNINVSSIHIMTDDDWIENIRSIQATNYREETWSYGQGIGSGAGYLEVSNGTLAPISN